MTRKTPKASTPQRAASASPSKIAAGHPADPTIPFATDPTQAVASGHAQKGKRLGPRRASKAIARYALIAPVTPGTPEYVPDLSVAEHTRRLAGAKVLPSPDTDRIYRLRTKYLAHGRKLEALEDAPRGGAGRFRSALKDLTVQSVILTAARALLKTTRNPTVSGALLRAEVAKDPALPPGVTLPCARTLARFVARNLTRRERVGIAQGAEAVRHTVTPKPGGRRITEAGIALVIDHRLADTRVHWGDRELRPWWTAAVDAASGAMRGLIVSPTTPGSDQIALAILDAVLPKPEDPDGILVGLPDFLWTDCGKDMTSLRIEQIRTSLGIARIESHPHTPWARGVIEGSCFATAARMFEPGLPGYVGNRPRKGSAPVRAVLRLEQYEPTLRTWFFASYNTMLLTRRRLQGAKASRLDLMRTRQDPVRSAPADVLARTLLSRTTRIVTPRGINLLNHRYWDPALTPLAEEQRAVEVLYHPRHLARILVMQGSQVLCLATDSTVPDTVVDSQFPLLREALLALTPAAGAPAHVDLSKQVRDMPRALEAHHPPARPASADRVAAYWPDPADAKLPDGL